jgi:hypothetical protein
MSCLALLCFAASVASTQLPLAWSPHCLFAICCCHSMACYCATTCLMPVLLLCCLLAAAAAHLRAMAACFAVLLLAPLHACSAVVANLHHARQGRTTSSLHRCDSASVGTPLDQPLPQAAGHPELHPRAAPCRAAPWHRMAPKRRAPLSSSSVASDLPPA